MGEVFPIGDVDRLIWVVPKFNEKCVNAGKCKAPKSTFDDNFCNWENSDRSKHPVNCVNWYQSEAYCKWVDKRLPTEAEWEKAARGPDGRWFPWGNDKPTCDYAVMSTGQGKPSFYGGALHSNPGGDGCDRDTTWPVGSKPKGISFYGGMDMAGNVGEWVQDWYGEKYYYDSPWRNPQGPSEGRYRVWRGGNLSSLFSEYLVSTRRGFHAEDYEHNDTGFRCARDAK